MNKEIYIIDENHLNAREIDNSTPLIAQTIIESEPQELTAINAGGITFDYGNPVLDAIVAISVIAILYIGKKFIDKMFK